MADEEVEKLYQEFWREIVETDGKMDPEKVKIELFDFRFVMVEVAKVYSHITGGRMSKVNYHADTVIEVYEECMERRFKEAMDNQ